MREAVRDIVCTWPKTRTLQSYLDELRKAENSGLTIGFRVAQRPPRHLISHRCYMVHDGAVRGWCLIFDIKWSDSFIDPVERRNMRAGWFIVRSPHWHEIEPVPMVGFRGWRYFRLP